jgi:hypothetical protein
VWILNLVIGLLGRTAVLAAKARVATAHAQMARTEPVL